MRETKNPNFNLDMYEHLCNRERNPNRSVSNGRDGSLHFSLMYCWPNEKGRQMLHSTIGNDNDEKYSEHVHCTV